MNGHNKISQEQLEMEENGDPERLSLSEPHKTVPHRSRPKRTVSRDKYCCFRLRFWSVHSSDQFDGGRHEREIKVSDQNKIENKFQ